MYYILVCDGDRASFFAYDSATYEQSFLGETPLHTSRQDALLMKMRPSIRAAMWRRVASACVELVNDSTPLMVGATKHYTPAHIAELNQTLQKEAACLIARHCVVECGGQTGLNTIIREHRLASGDFLATSVGR